MRTTAIPKLRLALCVAILTTLLAACSESPEDAPQAKRIASTAKMSIVEPAQGAQITGPKMRVLISLEGGTIVPEATRDIKPDEGHMHLSLDGQLATMTYGLDQEIEVTPGRHILQAEFVAGDHAPFNPRVIQARQIEVK
ncbi:MAG TPA: hypothetical protein VEU28_01500 [Actinomycetota bacterium]|nr:hypothetical protein [Actinomycetota bacterium]